MSRAGDIKDNLVTTLQSINGSPTYNYTMRSIQVDGSAKAVSYIADDQWPHFCVVYKEESREKEPGHYKRTINFDIVCMFQNPENGEVENWLEDIEKAISVDCTRGGKAYETWVPLIERDSGAIEDTQIYRMSVQTWAHDVYGVL